MTNESGYSGTPLSKKLGIKSKFRVKIKNTPDNYFELLQPLPCDVKFSTRIKTTVDLWHLFTRSESELRKVLVRALDEINRDGAIWVSWPKKSSGVPSEITEDTIRDVALPMGLVDVKVCAIDATWSGLKLVIRKELRKR